MRIAVIADIHGNRPALEAALAAIATHAPDMIVNLGDNLSGPLEARATADLLMSLDFPSVRGNHDRCLVSDPPDGMGASDRCAYDQLAAHHLAWLASLPPTRMIDGEVFLCHGTPASDTTYWMERVTPSGEVTVRPIEEIAAAAEAIECPVLLCGHTHTARMVRLPDGRLVVNPGSVGCPAYRDDDPVPHCVEAGAPDARFAILTRSKATWECALHAVAYRHEEMVSLARTRGRADWASGLATGWIR